MTKPKPRPGQPNRPMDGETEVTPEMAEAGGWVLTYLETRTVTPQAVAAKYVFRVMELVGSGTLTLAQVQASLGPKTATQFFETLL